jgi:hypothetical protein
VGDAGDAEIEDTRLRPPDHEDVGRLDVAMDHALRMGERERIGDAADDQRRLRRRRAPAFLAQLAQVAALQQLHRDVGAVVADAGVEDGDDVRMAEAARGARLVDEVRVERLALVVLDLDVEGLDRDQARQEGIVRGEHGAEAAGAELVLQRVAADVADRRHRLVGRRRDEPGEAGRRGPAAAFGIAPQRDAGKAQMRRAGQRVAGHSGRGGRAAHARQLK